MERWRPVAGISLIVVLLLLVVVITANVGWRPFIGVARQFWPHLAHSFPLLPCAMNNVSKRGDREREEVQAGAGDGGPGGPLVRPSARYGDRGRRSRNR